MSKFQRHFFVCVQDRPPGAKPACSQRGSRDIAAALQQGLAGKPELWGSVSVTPSFCLGPCFDGPTVVCYPEGTWYTGVKVEDVPEIIEQHMVGGKPVERLLHKWPT